MVFGISDRINTACLPLDRAERTTAEWALPDGHFQHPVRLFAQRTVRPLVASRLEIKGSRNLSDESDSPFALLMRKQTGGRHFTSYYERLKRASLSACFGGYFLVPCRQQVMGPCCYWSKKVMRRLPIMTTMVGQWDSWRLWESFAAGAAVLHLDFERHHFLLGGPLPEPMKHYVPVDLSNPAKTLLPLLDQPGELLKIGETGRRWAVEHYSSKPISARILRTLNLD